MLSVFSAQSIKDELGADRQSVISHDDQPSLNTSPELQLNVIGYDTPLALSVIVLLCSTLISEPTLKVMTFGVFIVICRSG